MANASQHEIGRVAVLGDSMSWIGGDSCQNPTGWTHYLKQSGIAEDIDIYARSGATWTNTKNTKTDTEFYSEILDDDNVMYNQAIRLIKTCVEDSIKTPELIILFAGANDAWFSSKRDGIFNESDRPLANKYTLLTHPSSVTSLSGSVALICDLIRDAFPSSIVIAVTPMQMSKVTTEETTRIGDIIESATKSRDIPTLRADRNLPVNHSQELHSPTFTTDGVHTNEKGATLLSTLIIDAIRNINRK